ncbi:unnamed protein product [Chironomus riparius]|uniref:Hairless n=1 Tax=Chironomus riparius TaxID=315576 RepID=A0A9N9WV11_9DIPT|nr:unnamed protein product [Chironomus riparius]
MKQKLKEKFNVGDKVKKTNFTKCVKMSKEVENLKNGVLNGDSVISNNHIQQQQHTKLNNSNVDSTTKAIVGGRLQFYKDGKFILELARAREGEKTGWISVPRKTFWPPTISTNSSTTFSKHESSTSLSYSDDNSSIQSSPWQRDHCWKQSRPRPNISKEMTFFYNRPTRLYLTGDCQKVSRLMRRRPLHKCGTIKFNDDNIKREKKVYGEDVVTSSTDKKSENESDGKESTSSSTSSPNDSKESISDTLENNNKLTDTTTASTTSTSVKMSQHKLDKILKKLADRISTKLALNGSSTNGHHANNNNNNNHTTSNLPPTSYSLASHIVNSINTQPHQHVSPRKRILRELEKVSLEDTKRSRPKTNATINGNVTATLNNNNNNHNNINNNTFSNGSLIKTEKAPTVSRPISSYSITSLLAHNTSTGCNNLNNNNSINSNDSLSTSHFHQQQQQQQRLSLNSPPTLPSAKSPQQMMHNKRKSPNTSPPRLNQSIGSPSQSPSPEHHAFHKYRPITTTPTSNAASSSPYNSSYHSPNYMRGSPSPHDRLRTTGNFQHSPSHYGTSSPQQQQNYSVGVAHRDSSLSPNVERSSTTSNNNNNNNNNRSTPTSSSSGIRTVPKKTAALRQQFSSPTMESSTKISKSATTAVQNMKNEKPMDVDSLLRPSALVPPSPISAALGHHPAASLSHYPYMYPPLSYLPPTVPPYYPSFYNPAMMAAAAAAAYRFPIPGYPQTANSLSPVSNTHAPSQITNPSSNHYDKNSNGHPRSSSISSSPPEATTTHHHSYVPTSPWNPISLTNHHHHSISDGNNLISKVKDEQSSDVPLNLSKH